MTSVSAGPDPSTQGASPPAPQGYSEPSTQPSSSGPILSSDAYLGDFNAQGSEVPPDSQVASNGTYIAVAENTYLTTYTGSGSVVNSLNFCNLTYSNGTGLPYVNCTDPKLIFDDQTNSWLMSFLNYGYTSPSNTGPSELLLYVSYNSDPTQGGELYNVLNDSQYISDEPKMGVGSDLLIAASDFVNQTTPTNPELSDIAYLSLADLQNNEIYGVYWNGGAGNGFPGWELDPQITSGPADYEEGFDSTFAPETSDGYVATGLERIWAFDGDPGAGKVYAEWTNWQYPDDSAAPNVPQPHTSVQLDGGGTVVQSTAYAYDPSIATGVMWTTSNGTCAQTLETCSDLSEYVVQGSTLNGYPVGIPVSLRISSYIGVGSYDQYMVYASLTVVNSSSYDVFGVATYGDNNSIYPSVLTFVINGNSGAVTGFAPPDGVANQAYTCGEPVCRWGDYNDAARVGQGSPNVVTVGQYSTNKLNNSNGYLLLVSGLNDS